MSESGFKTYLPGTKFQTLYLLHGGKGDNNDYMYYSNIARYAEEHKIAVITPSVHNSIYTNGTSGILSCRYWDYVFDELPRICKSILPISDKRENTFVAGLSMGAHGAMKLAILGCERFSAALLMSGVALNDEVMIANRNINFNEDDEDQLTAINLAMVDSSDPIYVTAKRNILEGKEAPKLFMTCGGDDFILKAVRKARDYMKEFGYDVFYEEVPGYRHEWDFWDMSLRKALNEWLPIKHDIITPERT
jgi:S-formylglutathione hydrolase FrmB